MLLPFVQDGSAVYGGANDPRMGTLDFNTRCRTCDCTYTGIGGNQVNDCPGHFGHMEVRRVALSMLERRPEGVRCACDLEVPCRAYQSFGPRIAPLESLVLG